MIGLSGTGDLDLPAGRQVLGDQGLEISPALREKENYDRCAEKRNIEHI